MWKPIDHRVRSRSGAAFERVYGWNGELYPRLSLCIWVREHTGDLEISCAERRNSKSWWQARTIPNVLADDLAEMLKMSDLKVGDEVQWTHNGGRGNLFSLSLRNGVIQEIKGDKARLRRGTPKKLGKVDHWIPLSALQPKGSKKSDIRDFMGALREAHRGD